MAIKKKCLGCNRTLDITEMATILVCKACSEQLTQQQQDELKNISKKGLPGQIVGMVFMFTALPFLFISIFSGLNFTYSIVGSACLLVGSIVNLSTASYVKTQVQEFLGRALQGREPGQPSG